ncbi:MAG: hypothetical protein RSE41_03625 [Clostridia bacterium]
MKRTINVIIPTGFMNVGVSNNVLFADNNIAADFKEINIDLPNAVCGWALTGITDNIATLVDQVDIDYVSFNIILKDKIFAANNKLEFYTKIMCKEKIDMDEYQDTVTNISKLYKLLDVLNALNTL